jgi:SSS family solute:Na+ symporter
MVAGRRLGPIFVAGSLAATQIGGGSSLGVSEMAYGRWGMGAAWYVIAMAVTFFLLAFLGPKLRGALVKTVPEYFRRRYGEASGIVTAVIMILPLIGLTAIQIIASSVILSVMTGLSYTYSVLAVSVVVTLYSVLGGLWAVAYTDVIQMFLIILGSAAAIPFALSSIGGWSNVVSTLPAAQFSMTSGISWPVIIGLIIMYTTSFAVGQESVARYYAAKDDKSAFWGSMGASLANMLYAFIPTVLGIITLALVTNNLIDASAIMEHGARYALPTLAIQTMPSVIVGLLFAGIISATMSSADSNLLGAGSIFGNDIYKVYLNKKASDTEVLKVTRIGMIIIAILSTIVALGNTRAIITVLMFAFTLRAGGAFIPYVVGHYWKKASAAGALASIIVGSVAVILVERGTISFFGLNAIYPGIFFSLLVFLPACYIWPNKKDSTELEEEAA